MQRDVIKIVKSVKECIFEIKSNYTLIKFSTDATKEKKFRNTYKVPLDEEILAHILKMAPLGLAILDGIIITNKALYINPKHCKNKSTNRIPLTELCKYVIAHNDDKAPIFLLESLDNRQEIFGKSILDANAGNETTHFLRELQQLLADADSSNLELRAHAIYNFFLQCRSAMKYSGLSLDVRKILESLYQESRYCADAVKLAAEDFARKSTSEQYFEYITGLPESIPQTTRDELFTLQEKFVLDFIEELKTFSHDVNFDYLSQILPNLQEETNITDATLVLQGLISARILRFSALDNLLGKINDPEKVDILRFFKGVYSNQMMQRIFDLIQTDQNLDKNWLNLSDGMGLTPLHYALILWKDTTVEKLLTAKTWQPVFAENNTEINGVYDYINLAQFKQSSACYSVLFALSDLMQAFSRSKKTMERKIAAWSAFLKGQEMMRSGLINRARSASTEDDYDYDDIKEKLDNLKEIMESTQARICVLNAALAELDEEMRACASNLLSSAQKASSSWTQSSSSIIAYLVRLYSDPELLYDSLHRAPSEYELYHYGRFYFVAPKDSGIVSEDAVETAETAQDTYEPIDKPYGDSWFSPAAHSNINTLRQEYRKLAKEYHPDVSSHASSTQIFQDILQEHADIIDKLGN